MARLDIQIFADASGVIKGMTQATNAIRGFESSLNKSTKSSEKALDGVTASIGKVSSAFKILDAVPFSFGDRAASESKKIEQSFTVLNSARFNFGDRINKELQEVRNSYQVSGNTATLFGANVEAGTNKVIGSVKRVNTNLHEMRDLMAATATSSVGSIKSIDNSFRNVNGFNKFKTGVGASNAVAQEFSRIVQDLPFGMIGIGNNIQQLTQNFATMRTQMAATAGGAVSMGVAIRASMAAILTPANLLVLGVAAVTSAYTWWIMRQQGGKKATDAAVVSYNNLSEAIEGVKKSLRATQEQQDKFVEGLGALDRATLQARSSAQQEIITLTALYAVTQDATTSTRNRTLAAKKMIETYPQILGDMEAEEIIVRGIGEEYNKLVKSIEAVSKVRAASSLIEENYRKRITNTLELARAEELLNKQIATTQPNIDQIRLGGGTGINQVAQGMTIAQQTFDKRAKQIREDDKRLIKEAEVLMQHVTDGMKEGALEMGRTIDTAEKKVTGLAGSLERLNALRDKLKEKITLTTDTGQLTKLNAQLVDVGLKIFQLESKIHEINLRVSIERFGEPIKDFVSELQQALDTPLEFGVKRSSEASSVEKAAKDRISEEQKTASKWLEQKASLDTKRIEDSFKSSSDNTNRAFSRALDKGVKDIYGVLLRVNEMEDASLANVIMTAFSAVQSTVGEMMAGVLSDQLKDVFKDAKFGLDSAAGKFAAAASLIGGVLGGVFKKTSTGGQALSGGLQGAASGAMMGSVIPGIGTAIGAVVGGVLGAVGGIFGASKAKKEERIQQQQLEEQRRQTKLMERQNALAYAGNVIGRMVEGVGIISGLDIDSTGNLVAKVEGNDIYFIYNRVAKEKDRGL